MLKTLLCGVLLAAGAAGPGDPNDTKPAPLIIGQSCALEGPAKALGTGMRAGLLACFQQVNAADGVRGRTIDLQSMDDGYEPAQCAKVTKQLIEEKNAFLLIGEVGTPTSQAAVPICEGAKVPFVGPFTGAEFLRNPHKPWVVNLRASYNQETEAMARHAVDGKGLKKVACFYQNDAFGKAGLTGIGLALDRRQMKLAATGTFERNTLAVQEALDKIAPAEPDVIVMVGPYAPCAEFIKLARKEPRTAKALLCNVSFVGTDALLQAVGAEGEGVIVTQVVPFPWDTSVPCVADYQRDMKAAGLDSSIGFVSLEGWLTGRLFCEVLAKMDGTPTREGFIKTVQTVGKFDLGGFPLEFGPQDNQGSDQVFLTVFRGGKVEPLDG